MQPAPRPLSMGARWIGSQAVPGKRRLSAGDGANFDQRSCAPCQDRVISKDPPPEGVALGSPPKGGGSRMKAPLGAVVVWKAPLGL